MITDISFQSFRTSFAAGYNSESHLEITEGRVHGGKYAREKQFPFVVQVRVLRLSGARVRRSWSTGFILTPTTVITAAHAVVDRYVCHCSYHMRDAFLLLSSQRQNF